MNQLTPKIVVFFHVCFFDLKSKEIVAEILNEIQSSGLLEIIDELHIGVIGGAINVENPKIKIHNFGNNRKLYEFPTLNLLKNFCQENTLAKVMYLHTKGASKPLSKLDENWRRDMLNCVVNNHSLCISKLDEYDTVGIRMLMEKGGAYPRHYSGNFRWANASYINTLCGFEGKTHDRYFAERRLCSNKDVLYCNIE